MKRFASALVLGLTLCMVQGEILINTASANLIYQVRGTNAGLKVTQEIIKSVRVTGRVTLSPVCPVEHNPPDPACAPRPYRTTLKIRHLVSGTVYRTVSTNALGTFALSMAPGRYILQVKNRVNLSGYPRCTPLDFVVVAKKPLHLEMSCDTGIR